MEVWNQCQPGGDVWMPAPPPPPPPPPPRFKEEKYNFTAEKRSGDGALDVSRADCVYYIMHHCFGYEISDRNLGLTFKAVKINPKNEHVWRCRRILLDKLSIDSRTELDTIRSLARSNAITNAGPFWRHRLFIVEKLGKKAVKKELDFIRKFLLQHPDNHQAWFNLEALTGTSIAEEREGSDFAKRLLSIHKNNSLVWNYRQYLLLGSETSDLKSELDFVEQRLCNGSNDEHVWDYRKSTLRELGSYIEEFAFTKRMLNRKAEDYNTWSHRWWIVEQQEFPPEIKEQELELSRKYLNANACNLYAWSYRRLVVEKLGCSPMEELDLTSNVLTADARNMYAWLHRRWVLQSFDKWEDETEFCDKLIGMDINNEVAWTQRYIAKQANPAHCTEEEYVIAACAICDNPEDEGSWMYLKNFYRKGAVNDVILEETCMHVLPCRIHGIQEENGGENIIHKKLFINALGTMLDLLVHGYRPSLTMVGFLLFLPGPEFCDKFDVGSLEITVDCFVWLICLLLGFVDPINKVYWYLRRRMLPEKNYDEDRHSSLPIWRKTESSMMEEVSEKSGTLQKSQLCLPLKIPTKFIERIHRRQEKRRGTVAEIAEIRRSDNLQDQLDKLGSRIKEDPCNHLLWHQRCLVAERRGTYAASSELRFTEEILSVHPRNNIAWSCRQLFLLKSEGTENELAFCNEYLQKDEYNGCAWDQRFFAASACQVETKEELKYAKEFILKDHTNVYPWMYLRNLVCEEIKYGWIKKYDREVEDMLLVPGNQIQLAKGFSLKHSGKGFAAEIGYLSRDLTSQLDDIYKLVLEKDCYIQRVSDGSYKFDKVLHANVRSRLVHAFETLKDLVCVGYHPSSEIVRVLWRLGLGSYAGNGFLVNLSLLGDVCPSWKYNLEGGKVLVHYREDVLI